MKNRFVVCVIVLVLCFLASGSPAAGQASYEAGTLMNFEATTGGWLITLMINTELASGPVTGNCQYYVFDREVSQGTFIEMAMGQQVEVEINGGVITLCRAYVAFNN